MKKVKGFGKRVMAATAIVLFVFSAIQNTVLPCYVQAVELVSDTRKYSFFILRRGILLLVGEW